MNDILKRITWPVAIVLALVGAIRPLLNITGLFNEIKPVGPIIVTMLIALIWIAVAVVRRVKSPVETLAAAGLCYGFIAVLLPFIVAAVAPDKNSENIPVPGVVAILLLNTVWGVVLGVAALSITKLIKK